jgi:nicotinamidase-related amidase
MLRLFEKTGKFMKTALLVIDLQRWYLERGHPEKVSRVGMLIAKTNALIDFFHKQQLPVVQVRLIHKADGSTWNQMMRPHWTGCPAEGTLTEGTWEAEPHPDMHRRDTDVVLTKTRGSAFVRTELEDVLRERGVGAVVLAGYSTNRCVGLTAIDAWERDFKVILAGEAILGTNSQEGDWMLGYLRRAFDIDPLSNTEIEDAVVTHLMDAK